MGAGGLSGGTKEEGKKKGERRKRGIVEFVLGSLREVERKKERARGVGVCERNMRFRD